MRSQAIALAPVLMTASLGANAADLVVWREEPRHVGRRQLGGEKGEG
jgi:hypothetical protein